MSTSFVVFWLVTAVLTTMILYRLPVYKSESSRFIATLMLSILGPVAIVPLSICLVFYKYDRAKPIAVGDNNEYREAKGAASRQFP